jgi:tetratricopeptide (TPR) repeat protein
MTRYTFAALFISVLLSCPAAIYAQEPGKPKITSIPGGFFVEWSSPFEIAAVQLAKGLTGQYEIMFDVPDAGFPDRVLGGAAPVSDPEMVSILADYWTVRGKPERAISLYESSLQRGNVDEKKTLGFKNNLAMLYSRVLGQHDKALGVVDEALEAQRDHVPLLDTKGLILLNSGNPAAAVGPLERAVELSCQRPLYCMHLAYALNMDGRTGPARRFFDPARDQLIPMAPGMTKEDKAMFDALLIAIPPLEQ